MQDQKPQAVKWVGGSQVNKHIQSGTSSNFKRLGWVLAEPWRGCNYPTTRRALRAACKGPVNQLLIGKVVAGKVRAGVRTLAPAPAAPSSTPTRHSFQSPETRAQAWPSLPWATKDMGKMLGGDEEKDPDAAKKEEERQEALRQEEEERKAKYAKMEAEREVMRQGIRDKYGIKKKEEREAEAQAAMEANSEGSLTRPKKAIPPGCGDEEEEEEESILDTVIKYLPGPLQDMFKK
ncbi:complexin-1-like [Vombatus ursinus]|uniref:complexin-1-like n=2 Tax=Metatheria TaxID=9263 RepID=UPI000FFDABA7|nr:complexin-1-like [Vombatus ursinus]